MQQYLGTLVGPLPAAKSIIGRASLNHLAKMVMPVAVIAAAMRHGQETIQHISVWPPKEKEGEDLQQKAM